MNKLENVDTAALRESLSEAPTAKAAKRLMIALAYADGVRVDTLSDRYGIPRTTVYSWLDRFLFEPIEEAVEDESRPGRPPKLSDSQREQLLADLAQSPTEFGYESAEWSPELVRIHLENVYETSYSLGHVRRLIRNSQSNK